MKDAAIVNKNSPTFSIGDTISLPVQEHRWWLRAWYFITFRNSPTIINLFTITKIESPVISIHVKELK